MLRNQERLLGPTLPTIGLTNRGAHRRTRSGGAPAGVAFGSPAAVSETTARWNAALQEHVKAHHAAALGIQLVARGWLCRRHVSELLNRAVARPELERAKEYARSRLPRDQDGRLLPLGCNLSCFQVFGSGVYCYMRWCKMMQSIFLYAFTLSLANIIHNATGGELFTDMSGTFLSKIFTATTLGNATTLNSSYGAVEVLVSVVM